MENWRVSRPQPYPGQTDHHYNWTVSCYLSPGPNYCEYQDTMTMMFTTIIMAGFSAFLTNNEVLNYIILLLAR